MVPSYYVLPALTDNGICYSFNAKHPNQMMKKTKYTEAFSNVFGNDDKKFQPYTISGKSIDPDRLQLLCNLKQKNASHACLINNVIFKLEWISIIPL